jgi:hypothetical protein
MRLARFGRRSSEVASVPVASVPAISPAGVPADRESRRTAVGNGGWRLATDGDEVRSADRRIRGTGRGTGGVCNGCIVCNVCVRACYLCS